MDTQRSEKTQRLINQMEARIDEMTPDERMGVKRAVALFVKPEEVGELRRFVMFLFTRLNARRKAGGRKARKAA